MGKQRLFIAIKSGKTTAYEILLPNRSVEYSTLTTTKQNRLQHLLNPMQRPPQSHMLLRSMIAEIFPSKRKHTR